MNIHKPQNLNELLNIKKQVCPDGWFPYYLAFFRGQTADWPIKPGVARNENLQIDKILIAEKELFEKFVHESESTPFLQKYLNANKYTFAQKWHNLFQSQHLHLKTRLTDWSQMFEHALFFSTHDTKNECADKEGVIYIYKCDRSNLINFNIEVHNRYFDKDPFELNKFYMVKISPFFNDEYESSFGAKRLFRQHGSFIVSPSNNIKRKLEEVDYINRALEKVIISSSLKQEIIDYLNPQNEDYLYIEETEKINNVVTIAEGLNKQYFS